MLFGHNTNVKVGDAVYHVQTEDRGVGCALLDTTVFCRGRVLHRKSNGYSDLLPLDPDREAQLKLRVQEQHNGIVEELRSGALQFPPTPQAAPGESKGDGKIATSSGVAASGPASKQGHALTLELMNGLLAGTRADLMIGVRNGANPVAAAAVTARLANAEASEEARAQTDANGVAKLSFDIPKSAGGDCPLVIEADHAGARGALRFQLRTRAKKPVAP